MKLSDAIVLGSTILKPKADFLVDGEGGGCALGMALKAGGFKISNVVDISQVEVPWPWTKNHFILPCECHGSGEADTVIAHLFDFHVMRGLSCFAGANEPWTMEQLVAWVRSVEPSEEVIQVAEMKEEEYAIK